MSVCEKWLLQAVFCYNIDFIGISENSLLWICYSTDFTIVLLLIPIDFLILTSFCELSVLVYTIIFCYGYVTAASARSFDSLVVYLVCWLYIIVGNGGIKMNSQIEPVKKSLKKKEVTTKRKQIKQSGRSGPETLAKSKAKRKLILLDALKTSMGIVSRACKAVGIPRSDFYKWCKADPEFKAAVQDVHEIALDFVEERHYALINALHPASIIFHLKTKGRGRGYIEKTEICHSGTMSVDVSGLSDQQLSAIVNGVAVQTMIESD